MRVAAIIPCLGRAEQTARNAARLLATSGVVPGGWGLMGVGHEPDVLDPLRAINVTVMQAAGRLSYWQALQLATDATEAPLLVNLANDLLPGARWLERAIAAYDQAQGRYHVLAFNDGINSTAHFVVARAYLAHLGGWPVWYDHMMGDIELVERARADGVFAQMVRPVLYHDHWITGADKDVVYAAGEARWVQDRALFEQRKAQGWPSWT